MLPLDAPWSHVLCCFCIKEATFKALTREEQVGVTFQNLAVDRTELSGFAWVRRVGDGDVVAEAYVVAEADLVVAVAKPFRSG